MAVSMALIMIIVSTHPSINLSLAIDILMSQVSAGKEGCTMTAILLFLAG